jgi:putative membrane protein
MSGTPKNRAPAAFSLDDPSLKIEAPAEPSLAADPLALPPPRAKSRGVAWGAIFWSALSGLVFLWLMLWVQQTILSLLVRSDWLGWAATILFAAAGLAFVMIVGREIAGLLRLSAITALRRRAEAALAAEDVREARAAAAEIRAMLKDRRELAEGLARLKQHQRDVLDAAQVLTLTERELLLPLDRLARTAIGASGRRVSVVTSLSPAAIIPIAFVAYENFRMLRTLAGIYGGRPGFFAILRLLRLIAGHLAVAGGLAFTDDIVQQFIGHGLTARLSHRLGEGLVNGGFTLRIGIAAVELLRPLPYIEARKPRLREFMAEFLKLGQRDRRMGSATAGPGVSAAEEDAAL